MANEDETLKRKLEGFVATLTLIACDGMCNWFDIRRYIAHAPSSVPGYLAGIVNMYELKLGIEGVCEAAVSDSDIRAYQRGVDASLDYARNALGVWGDLVVEFGIDEISALAKSGWRPWGT